MKDKDNTLTSCVYNYTQAPALMQVGCSILDLRCSGGTYIQIKSMHCGMTREWTSYCDANTPADCRAAQYCCLHHPADKSMKIRLEEKQYLCQIFNDKDACRIAIDVVSAIDYNYPRHYCLITYNCRQSKFQGFSSPCKATKESKCRSTNIYWRYLHTLFTGLGSTVGRVSALRSGGTGFDPRPRHNIVVSNTSCSPHATLVFRGRARTSCSGVSII